MNPNFVFHLVYLSVGYRAECGRVQCGICVYNVYMRQFIFSIFINVFNVSTMCCA